MTVRHLSAPPRLPLVLARGALTSPGKRGPYDRARMPGEQLVLPRARTHAARVRTYSRVCGFEQPGREAGLLPPTYPHVLGFPLAMELMAAAAFPFPLLGLVHTGIELTQHRALRADDADEQPEMAVRAEGLAPHRRGSTFEVVTEARLSGQLVWHSRSTYLCRHRTRTADGTDAGDAARDTDGTDSTEGAGGTRATDNPARAAGGREPAREPAPLPVHDLWDLPSGLGRRYGAVSGDRNPIHLHPLTAKLFGFPRHIAHGMWTFARALAATEAAAGGEQISARAQFRAPVPLPSTVAFGLAEDHGAARPGTAPAPGGAPRHVTRFELRGAGRGVDGNEGQRLHLTGEVSSGPPSPSAPDRSSRSS